MLMEVGRLTNEVKVELIGEEGKKVLNNRIAIPITKNQTTFIDIVAWNGTADLIGSKFKKGYEICVHGRLINKKKLIGGGAEIDCHAILVDDVIFIHGNPKPDKESAEQESYNILP